MRIRTIKMTTVSALLGLAVVAAASVRTAAYPPYLTRAQELGFAAKDCTYCHQKPAGGAPWNARGNWLRAEKRRRKAPEVEVDWLKQYRGR